MTRDELLKKLAMTNFCAVPTVQTMDMGLEFDFVDNIGAGTSFGSIGSWPLLKLEGMSSDKISELNKAGINVSDDSKHYKLSYNNDDRYSVHVSHSTSNARRCGMNVISDMERIMF